MTKSPSTELTELTQARANLATLAANPDALITDQTKLLAETLELILAALEAAAK